MRHVILSSSKGSSNNLSFMPIKEASDSMKILRLRTGWQGGYFNYPLVEKPG